MQRTFRTASAAETEALGRELAAELGPGTFVALEGPLGAGKTCLVRGILAGMGGDPREVSSPTYGLVHVYPAAGTALVHVDLYRIADAAELDDLGLEELRASGPLVVEWPERAGGRLGVADLGVRLRPGEGEADREIAVDHPSPNPAAAGTGAEENGSGRSR